MRRSGRPAALVAAVGLASVLGLGASVSASGSASFPPTALVSRATGIAGAAADRSSATPSISADGRYVAFVSGARNLSADDGAKTTDVYRRDMSTGDVVLVSRADGLNGAAANGGSYGTSISADGRYVAFSSSASNLPGGSAQGQVYVRDIQAGTTTLASRASGATGATSGYASGPAISADGRHVAFVSTGMLTPGALSTFNLYVRDLDTDSTDLVSQPTAGVVPPAAPDGSFAAPTDASISADGRYVAFDSGESLTADDLADDSVDVFVRDRGALTTTRIKPRGRPTPCHGDYPDLSSSGRYVAYYACDSRIAVTDLVTGATKKVSRDADISGPGQPPSISADGTRVAYISAARQDTPLRGGAGRETFVVNLAKGITVNASRASGQGLLGNASSTSPALSANGRYVVFVSRSLGFSPDDLDETADVYRRELDFIPDRSLPSCAGHSATQLGTNRPDVLTGSDRRDVIVAGGGADVIRGGDAADFICGGKGNDRIEPGQGGGAVFAGAGADKVRLGAKDDPVSVHGGAGPDLLVGSNRNDSGDNLHGDAGNDTLIGRNNASYNYDYLFGGPGDDRLFGGRGPDVLRGGPGMDLLDYGPGGK